MANFSKLKIGRVQLMLTMLVWLLILTIPILFSGFSDGINWQHIFKIWKEYGIVFILFLINRFVLLPLLFFKGKRWFYALSITGLILTASVILFLSDRYNTPNIGSHMPPPHNEFHMPPPMEIPQNHIPPFANLFIISILLIGFDTGLIFSIKWMQSEQNKLEIEKESIKNKMAFLQNQLSPHFFMNTLNNIHALVDIDGEEAKEAIIRLSKMMDYMLYESQSSATSIKQEVDFIKSYVELMKLRFTNDIDIILDIPESLPEVKIPPLLTISFIENAFKYGISYETPSYVHIHLNVSNNNFFFKVTNRIHPEIKKRVNSGIGIENTKKRLELLFGQSHNLTIKMQQDKFEVNLNIPL